MSIDSLSKIFLGIIAVAMVTSIVGHANTAKDITAGGQAFAGSLRAAEGN